MAGDATRAYSPRKLERFTRQIVYLRPDTFIIFDRVKSTQPEFKKTWLLQAAHTPTKVGDRFVIANGQGRLWVQTLLPSAATVKLVSGEDLYRFGDQTYPPRRPTGPAPECRIEISPDQARADDLFLHVLTASTAGAASVPVAEITLREQRVHVTLGNARLEFPVNEVGGELTLNGATHRLAPGVRPPPSVGKRGND